MEFRVLQYFLAVAREQSISGAAEVLHLSQPTLSRQLKDLEEELGKRLFIRGNRKITLTEEGMLLRKRAEEITELMRKTESEIAQSEGHHRRRHYHRCSGSKAGALSSADCPDAAKPISSHSASRHQR